MRITSARRVTSPVMAAARGAVVLPPCAAASSPSDAGASASGAACARLASRSAMRRSWRVSGVKFRDCVLPTWSASAASMFTTLSSAPLTALVAACMASSDTSASAASIDSGDSAACPSRTEASPCACSSARRVNGPRPGSMTKAVSRNSRRVVAGSVNWK